MSRVVRGLGVSGGIAIGRAVRLEPETYPLGPARVPPHGIEEEIRRFEQAREQARGQIESLKRRVLEALGTSYAGMLDAQILILDDPMLAAETIRRIREESTSARWALREVVDSLVRRFDTVDDEYLRQRGGDLSDVHRRLQRLLHGEPLERAIRGEGPVVVVAHTLGPSDIVALAHEEVVGFAVDVGGRTSHSAILAQALSVPAVVGLHDLSSKVRSGDTIILNGVTGEVEIDPVPAQLSAAEENRVRWLETEEAMSLSRDVPVVTRDGVEIVLRANIELPEEAEAAVRYGASGIGLYRSEFLFLLRSPSMPTEEEHYRTYRTIGERVAPHPAVIRTLDLGGEKYFHEVLDRDEPNPVLGLRAVRFCLKRPDVFLPQIRGLLRAAAHVDLKAMIPLVTTPDEIRQVRRIIETEAENLRSAGVACRPDLPLGIMVEVPAAAVTADVLARDADFLSLGTNDLIQYSLAVDRNNQSVAALYEPLHPSILRMIRFVIRSGKSRDVPVSLCGEMAADPDLAALLVGLGLREFSVPPRAVAPVREAIRKTDASQALRLAEEALGESTADRIGRRLKNESAAPSGPG